MSVDISGVVAPEPGSGMVAFGCAGFTGASFPYVGYWSVFVGSWHDGSNGSFCSQTLGEANGAFTLAIPRSCRFSEGATVYLTAGGLPTCVSVPYHAGTSVFVELLGHSTACP